MLYLFAWLYIYIYHAIAKCHLLHNNKIFLIYFVDNINCDELIIHCYAGISRSAAVAAAISEYLKINLGSGIFNSLRACMNK